MLQNATLSSRMSARQIDAAVAVFHYARLLALLDEVELTAAALLDSTAADFRMAGIRPQSQAELREDVGWLRISIARACVDGSANAAVRHLAERMRVAVAVAR